uniref:Uncharacterized protein n=1 Tax=Cacopsylla melanoneura TaxID=428564 RepID=A0A8D8S7E3_9HEMI
MSSSSSLDEVRRRHPLSPTVIVREPIRRQETEPCPPVNRMQETVSPTLEMEMPLLQRQERTSAQVKRSAERMLTEDMSPVTPSLVLTEMQVFQNESTMPAAAHQPCRSKKRKLLQESKSPATTFVENMSRLPEKQNRETTRRKRKRLEASLLEELQSMSPSTQSIQLRQEWTLLEEDMQNTRERVESQRQLEREKMIRIAEKEKEKAVKEQAKEMEEKQNKIRDILRRRKLEAELQQTIEENVSSMSTEEKINLASVLNKELAILTKQREETMNKLKKLEQYARIWNEREAESRNQMKNLPFLTAVWKREHLEIIISKIQNIKTKITNLSEELDANPNLSESRRHRIRDKVKTKSARMKSWHRRKLNLNKEMVTVKANISETLAKERVKAIEIKQEIELEQEQTRVELKDIDEAIMIKKMQVRKSRAPQEMTNR